MPWAIFYRGIRKSEWADDKNQVVADARALNCVLSARLTNWAVKESFKQLKLFDGWEVRGKGVKGEDRRKIYLRDKKICYYCKSFAYINQTGTVDHKLPKCKGGTDDPENLVWACLTCNAEKGKMTEPEYTKYKQRKIS